MLPGAAVFLALQSVEFWNGPGCLAVRELCPSTHSPEPAVPSGLHTGYQFPSLPPPPVPAFLLPSPTFLSSAFLNLLPLFRFMNHDTNFNPRFKKKNVLYFTLLAVIKFCPQQGHRCFHGDRYTLKPRRTAVEKKSMKKAKRLV